MVMASRFSTIGFTSLALALPGQAVSNDAARFWVKPVELQIVAAREPFSRSLGPSKFFFSDQSAPTIAVDHVKVRAEGPSYIDGDSYFLRQVYWRFSEGVRLIGPYDISRYYEIGNDGESAYFFENFGVSGQDATEDGFPEDRVWSLAPSGGMRMVEGPWTGNDWDLSSEYGSPTSGKIVLRAWANDGGRRAHQGYFAIKNGVVEPLGTAPPFIPFKIFTEQNIAIQAGSGREFVIRNLGNDTDVALSLPHTSEYGGWESLNIDRYGWLFAEGYGNDYAIKLTFKEGLTSDRIHRFTGRGWLGRFFEWIFNYGPESQIDSTQWSSQCADYSPILRLTLFCDPAKVLRDGTLQDMPVQSSKLDRYLGDATAAGVALIKGQQSELYAFDGEEFQLLADDLGQFVKAQDVPQAKRTFVTSGSGAYELVGNFPNLTLVALASRNHRVEAKSETENLNLAFRRLKFLSFPDSTSVLGIDDRGVWHFGKDAHEMIWQAPVDPSARILTSEVAPVSAWGGLVFLTADNKANLIIQCSN